MGKKVVLVCALLFIATGLFSFAFVSDDTDFSVVYTPHYKIIFPSKDSLEIPYLAYIAEDVYYYTTGWMGIYPDYRINLIIYDGMDLYNGFSTPLPSPTIFIYLNHPDPFFGNRMKNWYRLLITHELTHTLQMNGKKRKHNLLYSWKMSFWPTWYLEGIAVYNESFISGSNGRLNNVLYKSYMRAFVKDNKFPPVMLTMNNFNRFFPSGKDYLWGSLAYKKAIKDEGYGRIMEWDEINRKITEYLFPPIPFYIWAYYKYMRAGVKEFAGEMKKEVERMDSISIKNPDKLTDKDYYQILPVFDERDSILYYWSSPSKDITYLIKRNKNGKEKKLVEGLYPQSLFLDTMNNYLYYEKLDLYKNTDYYYSIYRYNLKTGKEERIEHTLRGTNPVIVGDTMYYVYRMIGKNGIMMMNLKTGYKRDLFSYPFHYQIYGMSVSPDNKKLAISLWRPGGYTEIDIINLLSHRISTVVRDTFFNIYPQWSCSGDTLFFLSDREGTYGIYAYSLKDNFLLRYCFTSGLIRDFWIGKDYIYYSDLSSSGWNIYKIAKEKLNVLPINFYKEKYISQEPYLNYPGILGNIVKYDWKKNLSFNYLVLPYPIGLFGMLSFTDDLFKRGFVFFANGGWLLSPILGPFGLIAFYNGAYTSYYFISYYYSDLNDHYYGVEVDRVYTNVKIGRDISWTLTAGWFSDDQIQFGSGLYYSTLRYARMGILPVKGYEVGVSFSGAFDLSGNYTYLLNNRLSVYHKNILGSGKLSFNIAYSNDTINSVVNMYAILDTLGIRRYSLISYGYISLPSSNMVNGISGEWFLPPFYIDNLNFYFIMLGDVSLSLFGELFYALPSYYYDGNIGVSFNLRWKSPMIGGFTTSLRYYYNYSSSNRRWSIVIQ